MTYGEGTTGSSGGSENALRKYWLWLMSLILRIPKALFGDKFDPEPVKFLCYVLASVAALVAVSGIIASDHRNANLPAYVVYCGYGVFSELCLRAAWFLNNRQERK